MTPERRREQFINTALELYSQRPPEDVSIDDIVTAADVSRALFYRYFTNIRDLHIDALGSIVDELIHRLTLTAGADFRQQLHRALAEFVTFAETYASGYTALLRSGSTISTSDTDTLVGRVREHVVNLIREALGFAQPDPMLVMTLRGWVSVVETTILCWLDDHSIPREQLESWLVDQLRAMAATTSQYAPESAGKISRLLGPESPG